MRENHLQQPIAHRLRPNRIEPLEVGGSRVTPHLTTHLAQLRDAFSEKYPAKFEAFSFVLETEDVTIAHSADIGGLSDLEPLLLRERVLLFLTMMHRKAIRPGILPRL